MLSSDINCYTVMSRAVYMPRAIYKNRNKHIIVLPPQLLYLNSFHVKQECYCLFGFFSFKTTIEKTSHNYCKQNSWLWVYQIFFVLLFEPIFSSPNKIMNHNKPRLYSFLGQCANLQGVKMLCSNAEGASLKLCNFEDPSGLKANLECKSLSVITFSKVKTHH